MVEKNPRVRGDGELMGGKKMVLVPAAHQFQVIFLCNLQKKFFGRFFIFERRKIT